MWSENEGFQPAEKDGLIVHLSVRSSFHHSGARAVTTGSSDGTAKRPEAEVPG